MVTTNSQSGTNVHEIADGFFASIRRLKWKADWRILIQPISYR